MGSAGLSTLGLPMMHRAKGVDRACDWVVILAFML